MGPEYKSIIELYREIKDFRVFELLPHVLNVPSELALTLVEPEQGLYLTGSVTPLIRESGSYDLVRTIQQISPASDKVIRKISSLKITYKDILDDVENKSVLSPGDICDCDKGITIPRHAYERNKKHLSLTPSINTRLCEAAVATVISYLNGLCKYTHVHPQHYELSQLVKPEFAYVIHREEFEGEFNDLYIEVSKFVKNDNWCIYSYEVIGTCLVIKKGLDYRILEWHKQQIEKLDNYDEMIDSVQDGYAPQYSKRR